jgi:RNA polymerase sigma-70 factor (ECF subfamily)
MRRRLLLDSEALGELFLAHGDGLLRFFTRRTFDGHLALDLVAETFAEAVANRRRFRGSTEAEAVAWLYGIARNELSDYLRRGSIELRALNRLGLERPELLDEELAQVEDAAIMGEIRATVAQELGRLTLDHREVLELRVIQELPYEAVAKHLGVSEQAARARVSRALRRLEAALPPSFPTTLELRS